MLKAARVGPNVSIGRGSVIEKSELTDTLVGSNTKIVGSTLRNSLIGDSAVIEGVRGELTLSDHSEVRAFYVRRRMGNGQPGPHGSAHDP